MPKEIGKPMHITEVPNMVTHIKLLDEIRDPDTDERHVIKYIDFHYDTRTQTVFGVTFRCFSTTEPIHFTLVNEHKHKDLYHWIMEHHKKREHV